MLSAKYYLTMPRIEPIIPTIGYLNAKTIARQIKVTELMQRQYTGDFYGLLLELRIPPKYWLPLLFLNGYTHPGEYYGSELILVSDVDAYETMLNSTKINTITG